MRENYHVYTQEEREYLFKNFHNTSNDELASVLGLNVKSIESFAFRNRLRKSHEYIVKQTQAKGRASWRDKESHSANISKSRLELFNKERMRIRWGLPQKTKYKVTSGGHRRSQLRYELRQAGYQVGTGANEAYYDNSTVRSAGLERRAAKQYITVKEANKVSDAPCFVRAITDAAYVNFNFHV